MRLNGSAMIEKLDEKKKLIDSALERFFPEGAHPASPIYSAMRYSLFPGGKRIRPVLALAATEAVGGDAEDAIAASCAIELIHTYSLIHDDLPAMDDDKTRRGKPTSHIAFGQAMAVLAGDALLTYAFEILSSRQLRESLGGDVAARIINEVANAAGPEGMIAGQVADLESERCRPDAERIRYIHSHKTGALIAASVRAGAIIGGAAENQLEALTKYGRSVGLCFQVVDDILDEEGESLLMGKDAGSDEKLQKLTYPKVFGLDESKKIAKTLSEEAVAHLAQFDSRADLLRFIATYVYKRSS